MTYDTDIAKIAAGLTKAQRLYMKEGPHRHWTPTLRVLKRLGLTDAGGDLTPLGLAVRAHIQENTDVNLGK